MRLRTAGTVRPSLLVIAAIFLLAACGLASVSPVPSGTSGTSLAPSNGQSLAPSTSDGSAASPSDSPGTIPSGSIRPSVAPTPSGSVQRSPGASSPASVCSGAKDTPDFYESFAGSVNFTVYCAVLPAGWGLVSGKYALANGGRITISFRRKTDSATFELDEGSFCSDGSGCVPGGSSAGSGAYGDLNGDLVQTSNGFALVVARGVKPSWLAVSTGLDQPSFLALTGALHSLK